MTDEQFMKTRSDGKGKTDCLGRELEIGQWVVKFSTPTRMHLGRVRWFSNKYVVVENGGQCIPESLCIVDEQSAIAFMLKQ